MQSPETNFEPQKLFGTDGIRGVAGEFPLDEETVRCIGRSLAEIFSRAAGREPRFVTGRDTRESGDRIESAFHEGAVSGGAICDSAGVMTTPGVAFVTGDAGYDAGIVISASHNPFMDNGIKVFSPNGKKLPEEIERRIEAEVQRHRNSHDVRPEDAVTVDGSGATEPIEFQREYLDHLRALFPSLDLTGMKIVMDCANGAASFLAPELFRGFGAELAVLSAEPDGRNINENCGSLHLEQAQKAVTSHGADIGIAFDGDADRALFVDENGDVIDGDATLWILAGYMLDQGELISGKVVATVMSNIGLELALKSRGLELLRTSVGDKYVLDELLKTGAEIGGEQSGHIICPRNSLVGDGMLTALSLLRVMRERGKAVSELLTGFQRFPQILVNVRVRNKTPFENVPAIAQAAAAVEARLEGRGRLLLRYSGTENLARVMIEGSEQAEIDELADQLADVIRTELG